VVVAWILEAMAPTTNALSAQAVRSRHDKKIELIYASLCESFGKFDKNAPVGRILDFFKRDDEPQTLNDVEVDLILQQQLPQFIDGIGIFRVHDEGSRSE
jgi:hypothetical protein